MTDNAAGSQETDAGKHDALGHDALDHDASVDDGRRITIESLEEKITEEQDELPFLPVDTSHHRWLMTACLAGAIGGLFLASSLLGIASSAGTSDLTASSLPQPIVSKQFTTISAKGDFKGDVAEMKPYRQVVSQQYRDGQGPVTGSLVFQFNDIRKMLPKPDKAKTTLASLSVKTETGAEPQVLDSTFVSTPDEEPGNLTDIAKSAPPPEPVDKTVTLASGETLIAKLGDLGISSDTAAMLARAIEPVFPAKLFRQGQEFTVTLDRRQDFYGNEIIYPVQVSFSPGPKEEIVVEADEDGRFIARVEGGKDRARSRYAHVPTHFRSKGRISSSLYATAKDKGVPHYIVAQMIKAFSYEVDFQRQVKAGDKFDIFFGEPLSGSSKKRKVLHSATLIIGGKKKTYYRFTPSNGKVGYFDENGHGAERSLMQTPISGARISSSFGMRRHPILGYSRLHTGVDFAAARGTPIRAGGAGIIEYARWRGTYGRTVIIRHGKRYKTLYAHMSRIASGIRAGRHVQQGQVIGYVGSTGRSTGPHLHYEVRLNGRPVNPKRVRVAGNRRLSGSDLARFKRHKVKLATMMKRAPTATRLAQVEN